MDVEAHSIMAGIHKAQHEKQAEQALKEDMCTHKEHYENALKNKDEKMAGMHEAMLHEDETDLAWHAQLKEKEERAKEIAVNRDTNFHEERMEQAARRREELAAKRHVDAEHYDDDIEEHRKKAALRHAAATSHN
uniref:Uncharacterized protein n=1 Tax=Plectus sambesii TaxID=2011161 RepID=A0A914VL83_9BILA